MLDILEFNASLYSALEKEKKDKEIILNYGKHLAHARSESNIELQIANWIAQFKGITQGDEFNKTPEGSKRICEQLIPECAKLIRRASKKGADAEQISQLKNARSFLDNVLEEANKAISSKSYNQNAPSYARHSEEDDEGLQHKNGYKYLYITDKGRYVYPEDLKRKREGKPVLAPKGDLIKAGEANRQAKIAKNQYEKEKKAVFEAKTNVETDKAVETIRENAKAKELMKNVKDAENDNKIGKEAGEEVGSDALKKKKLSHSFVDDSYPDDYKGMSVDEYLSHATFYGSHDVSTHLEHHGVEGMKWGQRRWQNEDGSLTPEGRAHYGYGADGVQSKQGKKLQKYATRQHARYDKFSGKREKILDRDIEKRKAKYEKDPSDKNRSKYVDALQRRIENEEIRKFMHNKIDDLTMDTWKDDRKAGRMSSVRQLGIGNIEVVSQSVDAAKKGLYGTGGNLHDLAKYNQRLSKDEYKKIQENARDAAIKKFYEETNPGKKVNMTVLDGSKEQSAPKTQTKAPVKANDPYWRKYSEGTEEYKQAQNKALAAEKPVFKAEHEYFDKVEQYGENSPQAETAKKKYKQAYNNFENKYGYSPQERD